VERCRKWQDGDPPAVEAYSIPLVIADYRGLTSQPPLVETPTLFYGELSKLQSGTAFKFPGDVRGTNFSGNVPMT